MLCVMFTEVIAGQRDCIVVDNLVYESRAMPKESNQKAGGTEPCTFRFGAECHRAAAKRSRVLPGEGLHIVVRFCPSS